ncbi:hypothetical protein BC835DRAFT_1311893 [Cytidiella melzeri]|nr:hypothetical protein BC835DRAFT_1311893 [Cytidiella melzeri]
MKERGIGKPWTKEEDNLLIQAVHVHGENDSWKAIALCVPGRTNKACRKRWLHSLSPYVKKSAWTQDEDQILLRLYAKHGTKWSTIARDIPGRTDDACSKRYREALDPSLRRDEWTTNEDRILLEVYTRIGGKWGQVGQELNRSGLACRNRWRMLERKKAQNSNRKENTVVLDTHYAADSEEQSSVLLPPTWDLPPPYVGSPYWDTDNEPFVPPAELMQEESPGQFQPLPSTAYLSPVFPSIPDAPEYQEPAPFRFTSSSLSAALSLSSLSPSSTHAGSPTANRLLEAQVAYSTQPPNDGSAQDCSSSPIAATRQPQIIPSAQEHHSSSSSSSSSPDLSALGSQDLSLPVPFEDYQRESCALNHGAKAFEPRPTRAEESSYAISGLSPVGDDPLQISTEREQSPEQDPARHYRTPAEKKKAADGKITTTEKRVPRHSIKGGLPRLCASLPASDDVLAYVCGHETCWPPGQAMSRKCYRTSQELYDHWKVQHLDDAMCERPYRCGLPDCGKGWKSINGLQYHLQLSKAHFQKAISASITHQPDEPPVDADTPAVGAKKKFVCPRSGCTNQYKQMSGLRYHLTHGHSQQLPHQLNYVPPALARKVADKLHPQSAQEVLTTLTSA